ncbi:MAG: hypothetical protein V4507_10830, partial [Verrucomicrobiota bacterium]
DMKRYGMTTQNPWFLANMGVSGFGAVSSGFTGFQGLQNSNTTPNSESLFRDKPRWVRPAYGE